MDLESRSPKSRCQQGPLPLGDLGENFFQLLALVDIVLETPLQPLPPWSPASSSPTPVISASVSCNNTCHWV